MHLVMFDIDGTLTETKRVDEECFVRSFNDVFGLTEIDTDWSNYPLWYTKPDHAIGYAQF